MLAVGWEREKKGHPDPMKSARRVEDKSSYEGVIVALVLAGLVILRVPYLFVVTW
jgi:hypothetical protein